MIIYHENYYFVLFVIIFWLKTKMILYNYVYRWLLRQRPRTALEKSPGSYYLTKLYI